MAASFAKPPRQDVFDPVNPHGHIRGRQPRDFSDGNSVHGFEIRDDDLPVERLELLNQHRQPFQIYSLVRGELALILVRECFELLQIHEIRKGPALAKNVRSGNMVGNAIDPGPSGTAGIEPLETPPQLKMDLLDQVTALFGVNLVCAREPFERRTVLVRRVPVQVILARLAGRDRFTSSHI